MADLANSAPKTRRRHFRLRDDVRVVRERVWALVRRVLARTQRRPRSFVSHCARPVPPIKTKHAHCPPRIGGEYR